ncbi:MAG: transposase [Planctomycetota bacterium]
MPCDPTHTRFSHNNWTKDHEGVTKRSDDAKGLGFLPKSWIVERTFGWLGKYRRLSKDYKSLSVSSVAIIQITMTNLILHRLSSG